MTTSIPIRFPHSLALAGAVLLAACSSSAADSSRDVRPDSPAPSAMLVPLRRALRVPARGRLSPLADSLARALVFLTSGQPALTVAVRQGRLLLDLGRVDAPLASAARLAAFRRSVAATSPVREGDRFRLHGAWGSDDATVTGYDAWNGRIVATLAVPAPLESRARAGPALVAAAFPVDSAMPPDTSACRRDRLAMPAPERVRAVGDSLAALLRADSSRFSVEERRAARVTMSHTVGCFGNAHVLLFVSMAPSSYSAAREMVVAIDSSGAVAPVRVADLRFRVHLEPRALDADGDGVDDVAAVGRAERIGGTVVLHYDPAARRLAWLTSGFAWEDR